MRQCCGCGGVDSVVVGSVFNVAPIILVDVLQSFYFFNHLTEEERACCFSFIVCLVNAAVSALCLFLAVSLAAHWSVIVVYPGHTHLLIAAGTIQIYV